MSDTDSDNKFQKKVVIMSDSEESKGNVGRPRVYSSDSSGHGKLKNALASGSDSEQISARKSALTPKMASSRKPDDQDTGISSKKHQKLSSSDDSDKQPSKNA